MLFVGQNRTTMPIDREITRPMLGTDQEPTAITWKSTLRSPVSSPRGPTQTRQSRSRTRSSNALQSSLRSRTPSPLNQSLNNSSSNLRKSHSGWVLWQTELQLLPSLTQVLWGQTPCMLWLNIRKLSNFIYLSIAAIASPSSVLCNNSLHFYFVSTANWTQVLVSMQSWKASRMTTSRICSNRFISLSLKLTIWGSRLRKPLRCIHRWQPKQKECFPNSG